MRHRSARLVAVLGILGACGSEPNAPINSNRLVVTVTGTVRSARSAAPIPGASLELYRISSFATVALDRDTTDADGLYRLSTTYAQDYSCADPGIDVVAPGYYGHFSAPVQVHCIEDTQIMDIYLDPEPVRLIVSPETLTLRPGDRQQFNVSATFADGTSGPPPPYGPWPPPYGGDWEVAWRVAGDSTCGWLFGPKTGESVEYVAPATALTTLCGTATVGQVVIVAGVVIFGVYEPLKDSVIVTITP
jgi:hypothetical protein